MSAATYLTGAGGSISESASGRAVETRDKDDSARGVVDKTPSFCNSGAALASLTGVLDLCLGSSSDESSGVAAPLPASLDTHSSSSSLGLEIVKPALRFTSEGL